MVKGKVVPFHLQKDKALDFIRKAATDTGQLEISAHFSQRMVQRKVSMSQVLKCMLEGKMESGPDWDHIHQTWMCRMCRYSAGQKTDVRLAVSNSGFVTLVTVIDN